MSNAVNNPIVKLIKDEMDALLELERELDEPNRSILLDSPTVYIHNWERNGKYYVYVGEANHIISRTKEHYNQTSYPNKWQSRIKENDSNLFVIGHEHFNKSLTLDIENRLIEYLMTNYEKVELFNGRGNPQDKYYPEGEFETIFNKIWTMLCQKDGILFPEESEIKKSALYKASPLHKLLPCQIDVKNRIINTVISQLNRDGKVLVFVEGNAGTGKTVLNSSTFFEILCLYEEKKVDREIKCRLLVNHEEQVSVYKNIFKQLCRSRDDLEQLVSRPTTFINNATKKDIVDVTFVDEAHLLWTQGKQSYKGGNQLQDIIDRSKVTVVMFDPNQVLTTEQYWEKEIIDDYKDRAKRTGTYFVLDHQFRMLAGEETIGWIKNFVEEHKIEKLPIDDKYEIEIFDSPDKLAKKIKERSKKKEYALSRLIATYDWPYTSKKMCDKSDDGLWYVTIGNWKRPWNREILNKQYNKKDKNGIKNLAWAEQPQTIDEVGSTYTIQGFDLNYAGVILGPSITYREGKIVFDASKSCNSKATRHRTLSSGKRECFAKDLLQHELNVLMSRGVNGLYIYACDKELRAKLLELQENKKRIISRKTL